MSKVNITDEVRRIVNETASKATAEALAVSEQAKTKAAEVSSMAIAKALDASTLAATRAAEAASAAATIAASTSKDLEYIKKDISDTKADIKEIKDKLDSKYVTKEDFNGIKTELEKVMENTNQFATVKAVVYGMCGLILTGVVGAIMYLIIRPHS